MNIYITRHGETEWNKNNRVCGRTDIDLTESGKDQAEILADKLATESIDLIISSPLKRATQTSKIISEICNAPVMIDDRLIEQDYGIYEGEDRQNPDFLTNKLNFAYRYPNGELTLVVSQVMFFQNSESRYLIAGCQIQAIRKLTIMRLKYITSIQNPKSINGTMKCGYP